MLNVVLKYIHFRIPQQPNMTDCGLFLCHNVETFFKKPVADFTMPITSLSRWFPDSETRMKRAGVAELVRTLATQQNQEQLDRLQVLMITFS